jgi:transcriptional regulator with XRE-family HTH domain
LRQIARIRVYIRVVTTTPIAAVLGINCKRIRREEARITQDELARAARRVGLKWTASKVRDFEAGRTAPTFATVLALTAALDSVTGGTVRLADLVSFSGDVTITEDFGPAGDRLADFCSGGTWGRTSVLDTDTVFDWPGLTEERIAAGLGIGTEELCDVSLRLWNTMFSAQRDRVAGPDASPQRKGRVTRQLKAELVEALDRGDAKPRS